MKIRFQKWFILISIGLLFTEMALAIIPPISLCYDESRQVTSSNSDRWYKQRIDLYSKIVEALNRGEVGNRQQLTKETQFVLSWKQLFQNNVVNLWTHCSTNDYDQKDYVYPSKSLTFVEDNHSDCNRRVLAVGVSFRPPYGLA